jgi:hypothetical protein
LTREQLQPPTPSVFLENKKHAFSPQLQEFCLKHPIAVVRQLAAALKLGMKILLLNSKKNSFRIFAYRCQLLKVFLALAPHKKMPEQISRCSLTPV